MNATNRELLERGYNALNKHYGEQRYSLPAPSIELPYIQASDDNSLNVTREDLQYLSRIREEMIQYPHLSVLDIRQIFPSLGSDTIHKYINILNNTDDYTLFGAPIQAEPEMYVETMGDKFDSALRYVSKIPDKISDWFSRLKDIIPSASTIYKSIKHLAKNNPNGTLGAKVIFGTALVALGTYGAKKIYDYVFKNDKTIENKELGLPKPETNIPFANINSPAPKDTVEQEEEYYEPVSESDEDIEDDIPELPPSIKPIELKILEDTMAKPEDIRIDHSRYIHEKIHMLLMTNLQRNRSWEPFNYRVY